MYAMASSKSFFSELFSSSFESGGITKHLMTGPLRNSEFCFLSASLFPSASPRGNKTHFFPRGQSLSAM